MIRPFQLIFTRMLSNNTVSVTRPHRAMALRTYPTVLVLPDGATINISYHEPRRIIKLPLDLSTLSEEERKIRIDRRKPKKKIVIQEEIEDTFDASQYLSQFKK